MFSYLIAKSIVSNSRGAPHYNGRKKSNGSAGQSSGKTGNAGLQSTPWDKKNLGFFFGLSQYVGYGVVWHFCVS